MKIEPKDIDISTRLRGSDFNKCEKETIAYNIILISKWKGDWFGFDWEDYKERCEHNVSDGEKVFLDRFVEEGILEFDGEYHITIEFIKKLGKFIKVEI